MTELDARPLTVLLMALLIFVPMLIEANRSARNERAQRARGGIEPRDDVYGVMRLAYPAAFLAMLAEAAVRRPPGVSWFVSGLTIFAAAKIIKWWAILTLDRSWTFRVIVVPGDPLVTAGPYRYLRHPNYVGVVAELIGAAVMTRALVAGPIAVGVFALLLYKRIGAEERALKI
jgi:methyltransferase